MTREEAIECIEAIHVQMFNSGNSKWTKACDMAIDALHENESLAKTVNEASELLRKQRLHGEWKEVKNKNGTVIAYTCSNCGCGAWKAHITKYCGKCGSKNGGDEE